MRTAFEREGDLRSVDILAAFVTLWREKGSGSLDASRPAGSCSFDIAEGEVVGVSSSDPRFETSAILVRAGKIAAAALERLSAHEGSDRALAALQAGILTKREWRWGEKIRAIEVLSDLLAWPQGEYLFDPSARREAGEPRLPIPRLLLELFLRSRDRNLIDHQLGPPDAPLARSENFEEEFATFGLTADAESVVRLINGRATAAEISRKAPADEFAVQKLLSALVTLKLVRPEYAPEEFPSQPAMARTEEKGAEAGPAPDRVDRTKDDSLATLDEKAWRPAPAEPERETVLPEVLGDVSAPADSPPRHSPAPAEHEVSAGQRKLPVELEPGFPSALAEYEVSQAAASDDSAAPEEAQEAEAGAGETEMPEPGSAVTEFEAPPAEPSYQTLDAPRELPSPPNARRPAVFLGWLLGFLLVAGAAFLLIRSGRETPSTGPLSPAAAPDAATPEAGPVSALAAPPMPEVSPGIPARGAVLPGRAAAPAAPPAGLTRPTSVPKPSREPQATDAPRPASDPRTTSISQPAAIPQPATGSATGEGRGAWITRAQRYQKRLASESRTRYAIQLELACEVATLQAAWRHDRPAGTMWLLPASHAGRPCFRVLWGRYRSLEAARSAKRGIPSFFVTGTNQPAVVAVR